MTRLVLASCEYREISMFETILKTYREGLIKSSKKLKHSVSETDNFVNW